MCWGAGGTGRLGYGGVEDALSPTVVAPGSAGLGLAGTLLPYAPGEGASPVALGPPVELAAGEAHTCARSLDGFVACWGDNGVGQLGSSDSAPKRTTPVLVSDVAHAVQIVAGKDHTCALTDEGEVLCWGSNKLGQLGDKTTVSSSEPVSAVGLELDGDLPSALLAGADHTCAVYTSPQSATTITAMMCWGANKAGQLGDGTKATTFTAGPQEVLGLP